MSEDADRISLPGMPGYAFVESGRRNGRTRYAMLWPDGSVGSDELSEADARAFAAALSRAVPGDLEAMLDGLIDASGVDVPRIRKTRINTARQAIE